MRQRSEFRPALPVVGGLLLAAALVLVPLLGAATSRPDDRSVLDAYLVALGALVAIALGAAVFLGWEVARHRQHRTTEHGHRTPSVSG